MKPVIPHTAASRFGVFTFAEALAVGWTPSQVRTAVERGRLVRLHRGCYVDGQTWHAIGLEADQRRLVMQTVAAMLAIVAAMASHTSAALLASLPVWQLPKRPCLTVSPRYTGDAATAHLHRATYLPAHVVADAPIPRLRSSRTILDIAREHGIEDAVVVGDCALARRMVTPEQFLADAEFCAGWPGIRRAERVLGLLDGRAESPLESVSRLRLLDAGLPVPDLQPDILDLSGHLLGRPDFYWDEFGVVGEVDGMAKYLDDPLRTVWREKKRQESMEEAGLLFVRWGRGELENLPRLRTRLEAMFGRGGRRPRSERGWVVEPRPQLRAFTFAPPIATFRVAASR